MRIDVIVESRRARRERRRRFLADVLAGVRAGLSSAEAVHRADVVHEERERVLAARERAVRS